MTGRRIRGNHTTVTQAATTTDRHGLALASSMAMATLPVSPMAGGREFFAGLEGHGDNAWYGRTGAYQTFVGAAVQPVATPTSNRLDPDVGSLPNTGNTLASLSAMTMRPASTWGG
jgi:hypothetical protein